MQDPLSTEWLEIDPSLYELAERWSWYWDSSIHMRIVNTPSGLHQLNEPIKVRRCCACHEEIYDQGAGSGIVAHLMLSHGYRMDGRQWNGRNELVGHA